MLHIFESFLKASYLDAPGEIRGLLSKVQTVHAKFCGNMKMDLGFSGVYSDFWSHATAANRRTFLTQVSLSNEPIIFFYRLEVESDTQTSAQQKWYGVPVAAPKSKSQSAIIICRRHRAGSRERGQLLIRGGAEGDHQQRQKQERGRQEEGEDLLRVRLQQRREEEVVWGQQQRRDRDWRGRNGDGLEKWRPLCEIIRWKYYDLFFLQQWGGGLQLWTTSGSEISCTICLCYIPYLINWISLQTTPVQFCTSPPMDAHRPRRKPWTPPPPKLFHIMSNVNGGETASYSNGCKDTENIIRPGAAFLPGM